MMFHDRQSAGKLLAQRLMAYKGTDAVVLGLPRGGVAVARSVADALGLPLDILVARKIGAPGNPEYAIGAVTPSGHRVLNDEAIRFLMLPPGYLAHETERQRTEAERRQTLLRGAHAQEPLAGRVAIVVDDGIATGMTMLAAIAEARAAHPAKLVVAVPVSAPDTFKRLRSLVDEAVALDVPEFFFAVGQFYEAFAQVSDEEVQALLGARVG